MGTHTAFTSCARCCIPDRLFDPYFRQTWSIESWICAPSGNMEISNKSNTENYTPDTLCCLWQIEGIPQRWNESNQSNVMSVCQCNDLNVYSDESKITPPHSTWRRITTVLYCQENSVTLAKILTNHKSFTGIRMNMNMFLWDPASHNTPHSHHVIQGQCIKRTFVQKYLKWNKCKDNVKENLHWQRVMEINLANTEHVAWIICQWPLVWFSTAVLWTAQAQFLTEPSKHFTFWCRFTTCWETS